MKKKFISPTAKVYFFDETCDLLNVSNTTQVFGDDNVNSWLWGDEL